MTGLVAGVDRIAVLRANGLGDFIFALPALEALRAAYPRAEIVLLARDWHRDLLERRPGPVDRVEALPHPFVGDESGPAPDPARRADVLADLREQRFDLAVQLHGGGRNSNPVVAALAARVSAGASTPDALALDRQIRYVYWQHEVLRNLEIVGLVGARPVTMRPSLAVTDDDRARAAAVLGGAAERERLVVLHPGASDPRRRWPPDRFAAMGDALAADGVGVVVTGSADESPLTAAVVDAMRAPALDLGGRCDLGALVGVLARADLVVANDTGPLHLASAVRTRSVGIFWFGNALNAAPPERKDHRPVLAWRTACPVCGEDAIVGRCAHDASFVADAPVHEVLAAARDLLGTGPD